MGTCGLCNALAPTLTYSFALCTSDMRTIFDKLILHSRFDSKAVLPPTKFTLSS